MSFISTSVLTQYSHVIGAGTYGLHESLDGLKYFSRYILLRLVVNA